MYILLSYICGFIFGLGLTVSNMINPNKVLNFLNVAGPWDPTLLVVMAAAVVVTFIGYQWVRRLEKPKFAEKFYIPERSVIDKRLVFGSAIFGLGWGIAGYCPGPGVTALGTFNSDPLYFVLGMILGSYGFYLVNRQ